MFLARATRIKRRFTASNILYSDSTNCDKLGRVSVKPVYIQVEIHNYVTRCKPQARRLIGYFPEPVPTHSGEEVDNQAKHYVYHQHWHSILTSLYTFKKTRSFLTFELPKNIGTYNFFPLVCFWMMDHPEQMKMCAVKDGATNRPCHTCEVRYTELADPTNSGVTEI